MQDKTYCYPNSKVLINKLNLTDLKELAAAEEEFTMTRLYELEKKPIRGRFDFEHLCKIHGYIFQDLYEWAGKTRNINISKGNNFCDYRIMPSYGESIFENYYSDCFEARNNKEQFVRVLSKHYGEVNALHPFREGNGRTQREFARELCLKCGYIFNLRGTTHKQMLEASVKSLSEGDDSGLYDIFMKNIIPKSEWKDYDDAGLLILSDDDLDLEAEVSQYDYYE